MKIKYYENDLPESLDLGNLVAIDTETMGLNPARDRLCLVQLSSGNGTCHLVKIIDLRKKPKNLLKLLNNVKVQKIFHFARFDVAVLKHTYDINIKNIYCTKIASKLARTYTDKHGYKDLCRELLNETISKVEQSSDWGGKLSKDQKEYAASDVLHLHKIKKKLDSILVREDRINLANACFEFISHRTNLDLYGWHDVDIFKH
ncbi:MAG: ribonuclease D [Proteobacteria bacterium]|nr:ribonuclease D [Pelagibacterales bacterium]MBL6674946.1 ribonuclease D [Alphaproteobacteria bacterium]MDA0967942.1 ribonuclease D [Pseudomonadota bacterium]MDA1181373.1 ribonuclease D [Pseudomonadota bacterium]